MPLDPIHAFYCRKDYLDLAQACKIKSGGVCAKCGGVFDISELRPHHKVELTLGNIDDVNVTLNPDNIEVLCHDCHNAAHKRFGYAVGAKHVYLVYGSPCAGKTTYVNSVATRNDLIVDLDKIHRAICICGLYDKPDATKRVAFNVRDYLLERGADGDTSPPSGRTHTLSAHIPIGLTAICLCRTTARNSYTSTRRRRSVSSAPYQDIERSSIRDAVIGWINAYWERYRE